MSLFLIERGGVSITVKVGSEPAMALIGSTLIGLRAVKVNKSKGIKLSVKGDEEEWHLRDHADDIRRKLSLPGDLIYHLTDRIVYHVADKVSDRHCLHAAAVCKQQRAIIIPANSGAGKSSFTAWLVANGFDYMTDELILIDGDRQIDGLARPIQIKANGVEAVKHLLSSEDALHRGKLANAVPIESLNGQISESSDNVIGMMVFPQYRKGSTFNFDKLSAAEAGMRLMANHVNARNLDGHGFRAMMEMIRQTPCYSLEYGGFDRLPLDFPQQLSDLLTGDEDVG